MAPGLLVSYGAEAVPRISEIWKTLAATIGEFSSDDCPTLAAALAYYAVFSLSPLLFLIAALAGSLIGWDVIESQLVDSIQRITGPAVALQLQEGVRSFAPRLKPDSVMVIGAGAFLLFAATGVLVQLQNAINRAWAVRPDPKRGFVRNFLAKRVLSLVMILVLTGLMMASVLASAIVAAAGERIRLYLPPVSSGPVLYLLDLVSGFVVFFTAFAAVFRIMPDATVEWRDVWIGSGVTAALLTIGKFGVGLYLGSRNVAETFGPAAALAVLLLWIYYSALIVMFGAEFTHLWAKGRGREIQPAPGAVAVIKARIQETEPTPEESERA